MPKTKVSLEWNYDQENVSLLWENASEYLEVVIVETREADCIFRSAVRGDGVMEVTAILLPWIRTLMVERIDGD